MVHRMKADTVVGAPKTVDFVIYPTSLREHYEVGIISEESRY
jgi:hypothetical protein